MVLQPKKSLIRTMLVNMTRRITLVVIVTALISYWLVASNLEAQAVENLEKYTIERGQRESSLFKLARDNQIAFREAFISRYREIDPDPQRFEQLFQAREDGTIRSRPELFYGFEQGNGNIVKGISGFIGQNTNVTPQSRRRLVVAYDLLSAYGPAWRNRFQNLYISMFDNMGLIYWPEVPWDLEAPADFDMTREEWFYLSDPTHNPTRGTVWTGVYYDDVAQAWMVSCITPIDYEDQHIATIGSDVLLTELLDRTAQDHLEGAYNLILRKDGHLIAHPERMKEIQEQGGEFNVLQAGDTHLARIFEQITHREPGTVLVENARDDEYIAVTQIEGPGWYLITVYPTSRIVGMAFRIARLVLGLGIVSLMIEILLLFWVLRRQIVQPLQEFAGATQQVATGQFDVDAAQSLPVEREDEIGGLARSFEDMAGQLRDSFALLQTSEEKYRKLFQDSQDTIAITTPEGHLLDINEAGERLFGYSRAELLKINVRDLYVDLQERKRFRQMLKQDGMVDNFETRLRRQDGTICDVLFSATVQRAQDGTISRFQTVIRDITERKRAEKERERLLVQIQEQAQQVEQIIDTVPEGVLLLDTDQRIVLANPMAERDLSVLAGVSVGDVLTHLGDRSMETILTSPPKGLWHSVQTDGWSFQVIARSLEVGSGSGNPASDRTFQVEGWVLVIRDVTKMREFEQRVRQQEKLAAVGQLAAGIAHDFNNIMANIVLYAQLAARERDLSDSVQERLGTINQQAHLATNLIRQILDFSRRSVIERQPLDLLPLLREQVQLLQHALPENIQVKLAYGADNYVVNADLTSIQQLMMNLTVNARDAMPAGGELNITLERVVVRPGEPFPLPEMAAVMPAVDAWVRIAVSDIGTGIPPDVLPHIFEPFFTTRAPTGSGLGLAQVHGIVGSHEGHIAVETRLDEGTTFSIYLPALSTDAPKSPFPVSRDELVRLITGQGETILVVEDDAAVRRALVDSLVQLNYHVIEAADGHEALTILERAHKDADNQVALILSDVVMPGMGGIALLHNMKQRGLKVGMVLLTGHPLEKELERLQRQDTDALLVDWLFKPPNIQQLAKVVARGIAGPTE